MRAGSGLRTAVLAVSLAAVQTMLLDRIGGGWLQHLDLPLAIAMVLVLVRPGEGVVIGFMFGFAVDLFQLELLGLQALAFCTLVPVAGLASLAAARSRTETLALVAAAQSLVAGTVLIAGRWIAYGRPPPDLFGPLLATTVWSVLIVVSLSLVLPGGSRPAVPDPGLAVTIGPAGPR